MDSGNTLAALLSCGLLQRHLITRLLVPDLLSAEAATAGFRHLITTLPDGVWREAIARTVVPGHPLAGAQSGCRQAVRQYTDLQKAVHTQDASIT